jgi:hypothetical protein
MFSSANFRARLPEHVRSLEKVAKALQWRFQWFAKFADWRCAHSPDAPMRLPTKFASTKEETFSFHLQHVANLKNLLE